MRPSYNAIVGPAGRGQIGVEGSCDEKASIVCQRNHGLVELNDAICSQSLQPLIRLQLSVRLRVVFLVELAQIDSEIAHDTLDNICAKAVVMCQGLPFGSRVAPADALGIGRKHNLVLNITLRESGG